MNAIIERMAESMTSSLGAPLAVFLLSMIPVAESKVAILTGLKYLTPGEAFGWAFLGSSIVAPILLLVYMPIINALSRTRLFKKLGHFMYDKFEKKSRSLKGIEESTAPDGKKKRFSKADIKKTGGIALFVAVPLPLTGVWTGSAVAAVLKMGFFKSLVGILAGNAVACGLLTLIGYLLHDYLNTVIWIFFGIIAVVVIVVVIKYILYKPENNDTDAA